MNQKKESRADINGIYTISQKRRNDEKIKSLPKSKYYREDLECLIGSYITLKSVKWKLEPTVIDKKECYRLLMLDANIVAVPKTIKVTLPIHVKHIWIAVDKNWVEKNIFPKDTVITCKGWLYNYSVKDKNGKMMKNIGMQARSIKPDDDYSDLRADLDTLRTMLNK